MKILLKVYSVYGLIVFALIFLVLLPFFLLAMFIRPLERIAAPLNHIWARVFFFLLFLQRTKVIYEEKLDPNQRYLFCANHFSYLDIPTIGLLNHNFKFIGKSSLRKVPIWGYMYGRLHVLVDRESLRSRYGSLLEAREAIQRGFSMAFFPEGGIISPNPPKMARFKEGSFRLAVEEQIPIVPITIPFNHIILPDEKSLTIRPGRVVMKVHQPIWPSDNTDQAIKEIRDKVNNQIQTELNKQNNISD